MLLACAEPTSNHASRSRVRLAAAFLTVVVFVVLALEASPATYYLYVAFTSLAWCEGVLARHSLADLGRLVGSVPWVAFVAGLATLEAMVAGFTRRWVFSAVFAAVAVDSLLLRRARALAAAALLVAVFPLVPLDTAPHVALVAAGAAFVLALALTAPAWMPLSGTGGRPYAPSGAVRVLQGGFALALAVLLSTEWSLRAKTGLPLVNQALSWSLSAGSFAVVHLSARDYRDRLLAVVLCCGIPYLLLSVSFEVLFYAALSLFLGAWVVQGRLGAAPGGSLRKVFSTSLFFVLLVNAAFFGAGNIMSFSSFDIASVYRFVTTFDPFVMGPLLIAKVLLPFIPVGCAMQVDLGSAAPDRERSRFQVFVVTMALWEYLTLRTLFLVSDSGSWLDIGVSISQFGICNAQAAFGAALLACTNPWTRNLTDK